MALREYMTRRDDRPAVWKVEKVRLASTAAAVASSSDRQRAAISHGSTTNRVEVSEQAEPRGRPRDFTVLPERTREKRRKPAAVQPATTIPLAGRSEPNARRVDRFAKWQWQASLYRRSGPRCTIVPI